ncbi:MAG: transporter [Hyphomicrobiaceae bacterium]
MAGFLPPPGTYVQSANYYYAGDANANLSIGGLTLSGGVDADVFYSLSTGIWVAPGNVMGGNFALSVVAPIGWKDVSAVASVAGPMGGILATNLRDDETKFGDPVVGATLGWHRGNYHWNIGALVNVPIGFWERGNLANIGFNRWAVDLNGALTYLDMATGIELSSAVGFTFNGESRDTDYKTGVEFHLELAAMQNFSKTFAMGVAAYYYDQITGDSGTGARLGDFEGRVFGIGPAINLTFLLGQIPVSTNLKYFHEFGARNRLEGSAGFVTLTMPLSVAGH